MQSGTVCMSEENCLTDIITSMEIANKNTFHGIYISYVMGVVCVLST